MTSVKNEEDMKNFGQQIGERLRGGEVIELVGDVGAGKTTFVKGLGKGLVMDEDIQSPSFTISRVYKGRDDIELHHYDFYRLTSAGIMSYDLQESIDDPKVVTIIEWAETVRDVLPKSYVRIDIAYTPEGEGRTLSFDMPNEYSYLGAA